MAKSVLFLIPTLENGGAEKVLVNLVNNMDPSRFDITVQTLFDIGVHRDRLGPQIKYKSFLKKPFRGYSHLIRILPPGWLYRRIVRNRYDIVVSYLEGSAARIISGCRDKSVRRIAWIHTVMDTDRRLRIGFLSSRQAMRAYRSFDRLVFVSESALNAFRDTSGYRGTACRVVYNTNETEKIKALSLEPAEDYVFRSDEFNICSVGKITPNKGFDRLAHILRQLREEGLPVHIYAVGEGEQRPEIEQYLRTNGIDGFFTFVGYRENPYRFMAACDLYVCASHREGLSTAVTEALIVGTAVVSTDCSGAKELLGQNNEYGMVVSNTEEALLSAVRELILNRELFAHYKNQALLRGRSFTMEKTVCAVERLLEEVFHE